MRAKAVRALPWLFGLLALGLAGIVIVRGLLWTPRRAQSAAAPPRWPVPEDRADSALHRAMELELAGKLEDAVAAYGRVLGRNRDEWLAVAGRAGCYEALERYPEALADLERLVAGWPRRPDAWVRLARAQLRAGQRVQARASADKAIELRPGLADPYLILGELEAEASPRSSVAHLEDYLRRAWAGNALDPEARREVEDRRAGTYVRRVFEMFRSSLPDGPERDARAAMEARWYVALKYADIASLFTTKYETLEHLLRYLDLARAHGDPDEARFARARAMVARLKEEIRGHEWPGEDWAARRAPDGALEPGLPSER